LKEGRKWAFFKSAIRNSSRATNRQPWPNRSTRFGY